MIRFLLPVAFVVIAVGIYFGYVSSAYDEIQVLRAEEAEFDRALEQARELENLRTQLLSKYNSFSAEDKERLRKLLPDEIDNVRLILEIDDIAKEHDLQIGNLTFSRQSEGQLAEAASQTHGHAIFTFSVVAEYEEFTPFLEDIERSLRLADVVAVSLGGLEEGVSEYDFAVTIRTYMLR